MGESAQFRLLSDITQSINEGRSLEEVFSLIFDRLAEFVPYHRIAIALADEKKERLSILVAKSDGKMVLGKGYSGQIAGSSLEPLIREGRTRIINDLQEYLEKKPESDSTRLIVREGMRSSLTVPLLVQGLPVGVMFFSSRRPNAYGTEHEAFIRSIVGHVSIAVEKSHLLDALRSKSEYLENILGNSADGIMVCDSRGRLVTWNEGARRIFGYSEDEVRGRAYDFLVPEEERAGSGADELRKRVERDGFVKDFECVRLTKDGRRITVNVTSTLMKDGRGRPIGRSSIVRDVTHVKKLQQDLINAESLAAVGQLAATVAHEIKNPLAGISGAIQVLRDGMPPESQGREVVKEILEQIERLDRTVRDLLTFARPATPAKQEIDLRDALTRSWSLLSQQPGASGIRFSIEGPARTLVAVDPQLLQQVWINLFQNAIEAMPGGGEVSVLISGTDPIRAEVRDTGGGVRPEELQKLFQPFFSTKTRGTGLGLAISRRNIDAHGGRMWVESAPSKGTSFFVEIPR